MLVLKDIIKEYGNGEAKVSALKGINVEFRENEFVAVLGPSGCGKTTLLNIIGGLDQYTSGDLEINNISTKKYKASDWDTYRNHAIGFVFQSYNLIPHQTVLSNVELALTLSGVSKSERKKRAREVLEKVGLGDQMYKKPNQMSGGQMQRVAIARALINNPDILLADEPTGALDSETSEQVMELLKEIAKDKLVIMVTHNPELADRYATRIIRLLDGRITDDTMEYKHTPTADEAVQVQKKKKKTSMSLLTALNLSLNNLMTKKARTFLTAFAGSIGIIGIALILSLSNGVQEYIDKVEEDTLSNYPITIEKTTVDLTGFMSIIGKEKDKKETEERKPNTIYTRQIMTGFMETMMKEVSENNLKAFKNYMDNDEEFKSLTTDIQYLYATKMNIYSSNTENGIVQVNPSQVMASFGMDANMGMGSMASNNNSMALMTSSMDVWQRLIDNEELLRQQYEVIAGRMPEKYDEVMLIVDENCNVTDYTLYSLGLLDNKELSDIFKKMVKGEKVEFPEPKSYSFDEIMGITFKLLINTDYYDKKDGIWVDRSDDELYLMGKLRDALEIKIVGIVKPNSDAALAKTAGILGYRTDLMEYLIDRVNESEIVKDQQENSDTDVFTGIKFENDEEEQQQELTMESVMAMVSMMPPEQQAEFQTSLEQMKQFGMSEQQMLDIFTSAMGKKKTDATYDGNLFKMGAVDKETPTAINIFPKDFEAKERITELIKAYNDSRAEEDRITYTDFVELIMSSVSTIINAISYILIAFVAISLIVSSIMIGIITYISVLERTKEIGILRAIGASKKDISRVFNAETLIVGFSAGLLGILVTLLLLLPINAIIYSITDIKNIAALPPLAGLILVAISMFLTFIAGLIPSRIAAKKDPVVALRSE